MNRTRAALVIARRDFTATVLSRTFFFFLLGPLFPLLLGGVFGGIGARVASQTTQPVVAVVMPPAEFSGLMKARQRLADATGEGSVVQLVGYSPELDQKAQVQRLLGSTKPPVRAVLTDPFGHPTLTGNVQEDGTARRQMEMILETALSSGTPVPPVQVVRTSQTEGVAAGQRSTTAQAGQFLLFFLSLLLSTMLLSQLIEEKSNKIIEVIAAAVPIDALFLGKLFAMLAACLLGIVVWGGVGAAVVLYFSGGNLSAIPPPAVGWPLFGVFAVVYFAMNYLLLGAVFLSIGAQASTAREVQILSMPVTFAQVLLFGLASIAIGAPDTPKAIGAAIFPLSSPLVMLARAAEKPELWPHAIALAWQAIWVGVILSLGALLFRRRILQSGRTKGAKLKPSRA
jgi:ABC-2 type transport system permease protein